MTVAHRGGVSRFIERRRLSTALVDGYAQLFRDRGATHELTISLGVHPKHFDPEREFIPIMRRITREIARRLRGVPKRKVAYLRPEEAVFMAGFYESTDAANELFPHWHGVIALEPGDEPRLRQLLAECVGPDADDQVSKLLGAADRPLVNLRGAKPTFHLQSLTTATRYIRYANKKVQDCDPVFWSVHDFLHKDP